MGTRIRTCAMCNSVVEGSFLGITVSLCCVQCCVTKLRTDELPIVQKSSATCLYGCKAKHLRLLSSLPASNRAVSKVSPTYLTVEVRYLGTFGEALVEKCLAEMVENTYHQRKMNTRDKITKSLCSADAEIVLESNRVLTVFLLGGFVGKGQRKMKPAELKTRRLAVPRVLEILRECPGAHPGAAFDFCLKYPDAGPNEFQELKDKVRKVFRLEGKRIFKHLNAVEILNLWGTPLEGEIYQSEEDRCNIHVHLLKHVGASLADKIMRHPYSQRCINRGGDAANLASRLLEFWIERHDVAEREICLENNFLTYSSKLSSLQSPR